MDVQIGREIGVTNEGTAESRKQHQSRDRKRRQGAVSNSSAQIPRKRNFIRDLRETDAPKLLPRLQGAKTTNVRQEHRQLPMGGVPSA